MNEDRRILIVDDDEFFAKIVMMRLAESGFAVEHKPNAAEALEWLKGGEKADLVVLDLIMPRMSGFEFLEVTSAAPELKVPPVIVYSNLAQEHDLALTAKLGAKKHFRKGVVSVEDLALEIEAFLKGV